MGDLEPLDIVSLVIYVVVSFGYLVLAYTPQMAHWYRGPSFFWTNRDGRRPPAERWAHVMLRVPHINAIQSMRGTIQGASYFGATTVMIAFISLFFPVYTYWRLLLFTFIAFIAIASTICFVQAMRLIYHLNYFVMALPREQPKTADQENTPPTRPITPMRRGGGISNSEAILAHLGEQPTPTSQGATTPVAPTRKVVHLKLEESLSPKMHERRLAQILQRFSFNFSLGVRLTFLGLPLLFGLFHDAGLIAMTFIIVAVLMWYVDRMM